MARRTIAVIIVNWNGWRHTLDCLAALRRSEDADWRLFIVDNSSTDGSLQHLQGLGSDVVLIDAGANLGWSGGNNVGIRKALSGGHESFLILNNDAMVEPQTLGTLRRLQEPFEQNIPVFGPVHMDADAATYNFIGADLDLVSGMPRLTSCDGVTHDDLQRIIKTSYIRGAGMFMHRVHFETVGFFEEDYFLNYDETDWCFRAARTGVDLLMVRDAVIRHVSSGSIGGAYSPLNVYFLVRNSFLFAERHLSPAQRIKHARTEFWKARANSGMESGLRGVVKPLVDPAPLAKAFRAGVRDYVFRRFGDCPNAIRRLPSRSSGMASSQRPS